MRNGCDSNHNVVSVVGVDISATWFDDQVRGHIITIVQIGGVILLVSVVIILLVVFRIKKGFRTLNDKVCDIADGSGDLSVLSGKASGTMTDLSDAINQTSMAELETVTKEMGTVGESVEAVIQAADVIAQVSDRADLIKGHSNDLGDTVSKYNA